MRRLLYVNSGLVLVIGIPLYLLPERTDRYFAWTIHPPLTAAVLRYPDDLDRSHAAAVAYLGFLATLLLGGYGWWRTRHDEGPVPTFDDRPA